MLRRAQGFTLLELLISVALLAVVVVYLMQTFTVHHKTYTVIDQTTEVQQNLRAITEILERDLRHAGMMVPEQGAVCGLDLTNGADTLFISDAAAVDPDLDTAANYGATINNTTTVNGGTTNLGLDSLDVEGAGPPRFAYDTNTDGVNDSDFRRFAGVIVTDPGDPAGGAACGFVTGVNPGSIDVNIVSANPVGGVGASLVAIPAHAYQITPPAAVNPLRLLRNGVVLTEGAEDLQVAYFIDEDEDGDWVLGGGEYLGDGDSPDYQNDSLLTESRIREVRVNVVIRTRLSDPETTQGQFQVTENRVAPGGVDGFRRRVHTASVRPRNVNR